jgi:hypothetical protein
MARTRSRSRPSEAERARRREAHRRQLVESVEALLTSDGWARWVRIRVRYGVGRCSWVYLWPFPSIAAVR